MERQLLGSQRRTWEKCRAARNYAPTCVPRGVLDAHLCEEIGSQIERNLEEPPNGAWCAARTGGNPACTVQVGTEHYVALTRNGYLDKLALFRAEIIKEAQGVVEKERYVRVWEGVSVVGEALADDGFVQQIVGTDIDTCSAEPGLLIARVPNTLYLGSFSSTVSDFNWVERIPHNSACSVAINNASKEEMAVLSRYALTAFDISSGLPSAKDTYSEELQPLASQKAFRWLHYGSHPRTVLLGSRFGVSSVDFRRPCRFPPGYILDLRRDWRLPCEDHGLSFFSDFPAHSFWSIVVTSTLLCIVDSRMTRYPVLEWNLAGVNGDLCGAVTALQTRRGSAGNTEVVVALAEPVGETLLVFHANSNGNLYSDVLRPSSADVTLSDRSLHHPQLLWSDLPLAHLDRFGARHEPRGITLVPYHAERRMSVVQSSPFSGAIAQLLGSDAFQEGEKRFEQQSFFCKGDEKEKNSSINTRGVDTFPNVLNVRDAYKVQALDKTNGYDRRAVQLYFHKDFEPGSTLHSQLRILEKRDARNLRMRIVSSNDDLLGKGRDFVVPRGLTSDLRSSKRRRRQQSRHLEPKELHDQQATSGSPSYERCFPISNPNLAGRENSEGRAACAEDDGFAQRESSSLESLDSVLGAGNLCSQNTFDEAELLSVLDGELATGRTLDELEAYARFKKPGGGALSSVDTLKETVESSPFVERYQMHMPQTMRQSGRALPPWVGSHIYTNNSSLKKESDSLPPVPQNAPFGLLLAKMKDEYGSAA